MKHHLVRTLVPRPIRNWLRSPSKSVHYLADRMAYAVGASPTVSPADGWSVRCHPAARHHFEVFRSDPSQAEELRAFAAHCRPGMCLMDVGAHYGFFALACLHYAESKARVLCVEASPKAAGVLRANLVLNGVEDQVSVMKCAMGNADGELQMLATGPIGGNYFLVPTEQRLDTVRVPQRTLESILTETGFQPTHIKMDIESFEFEALCAGERVLTKTRPILFLEIHGTPLVARGKHPSAIVDVLQRAGYKTFLSGEQVVDVRDIEAMDYNCRLVCLP